MTLTVIEWGVTLQSNECSTKSECGVYVSLSREKWWLERNGLPTCRANFWTTNGS